MNKQLNYAEPEELREEFSELETAEERIQFLIELGQSLPEFPNELCTEEFRVVGCQSMVWIVPSWNGQTIEFRASSDAPMVRGLVAVLLSVYSGKSPQAIGDFPIEDFLDELHLKSFLSPLRSNGLHSMIRRIREYAESVRAPRTSVQSLVMEEVALEDRGPIQARIDELRADFPILASPNPDGKFVAYLDNAASSQRPRAVIEAISSVFQKNYSNVHRSGHTWAVTTTEKLEASREAVRRYFHAAKTEEIIFTAGATASINLVANAWGDANLKPGDEILLSEMEHHSNIVPWQQLCERRGCKTRWIPMLNDFTLDIEAYESLLSSKVKLVAITAVSNVLGTINPMKSLIASAKRVGATVLVDGAQATPHGPIHVRDLDADFVVASGHKMLASSGVGILYGKKALLESMPAWQGGGSMIKAVTFEGFSVADLPHKFEAGTPPIAEIISLKPAIEYLEAIGSRRLIEHERLLVRRATEGLNQIDGMRIFSPAIERKSGIISFAVDGIHGEEIARVLDVRGVAIRVGHHCAMPLHSRLGVSVTCRASFYLYNTIEEVDRFIDAVQHAVKLLRK